jgi:hypothetical protein
MEVLFSPRPLCPQNPAPIRTEVGWVSEVIFSGRKRIPAPTGNRTRSRLYSSTHFVLPLSLLFFFKSITFHHIRRKTCITYTYMRRSYAHAYSTLSVAVMASVRGEAQCVTLLVELKSIAIIQRNFRRMYT